MKKRIWLASAGLILAALLAAGTLFAWFTGGTSTVENLTINTASIKIEAKLFQLEDDDYDGVCNLGEDGNRIIVQNQNSEGVLEDHDLMQDPSPTVFGKMFPGKTLTFLLRVTNLGNEDCKLNLKMSGDLSNKMTKVYSVRYGDSANPYDYADGKFVRVARFDRSDVDFDFGENTVIVKPGTDLFADFAFSIRFETFDVLKTFDPATFGALKNLNDYKGACAFTLFAELEQVVGTL